MPDKTTSYEELIPGYSFPPASYELTASVVAKYLKAVDGGGDGFVPPLAVTALAIATMAGSIPLPPGVVAIHGSQELEFFKVVPVGTIVECHTKVAQKIARGKMTMLAMELEVLDQARERVQSGKATIALLT
ncbi:MAG: MaoC family dehydratase N-terminal domain-containing protein [Dehalococcoidia bacterium]|nr:MaoC family dehydratase N-terminal domain-containing protein [Dehalococcoidia bacterium]